MPNLSWARFVEKIGRLPGARIPLADLTRLVRDLQLTRDFIAPHLNGCPDSYTRNPVHRCEKLEALVLCWEDGQETVVHDHGPSCSVAKVWSGSTKLENFRRDDKGERPGFARLAVTESLNLTAGDVCESEVGSIHAMGNSQGGRRRMVTVNFYSPPLTRISTCERSTGRIGERSYPALLATF